MPRVWNTFLQIWIPFVRNGKSARNNRFFIHFIAEELLLNIIKFGLREKGEKRYVAIKLLENEDEYIIRIRDNVHTYNPFDSSGDEIDNGVLKLITKKAKYYYYQRKLIFNYLYLII